MEKKLYFDVFFPQQRVSVLKTSDSQPRVFWLWKPTKPVRKVPSRPIQVAPWPRLMPLDTLATALTSRTSYMSVVSLRGGYLRK